MSFTTGGGQIPPEFNTFQDTLLVVSHSENWGYNHYLKKNFRENYTGPYKIISSKEIENYPVDEYRYIFDNSLSYTTTRYHYSTTPTSATFTITDRKLEKDYTTPSSSKYSKLMRAYIKALEENRKKSM
ncbi:hypothetical protein FC093_20015 [Ilyomonas limi]|uniref:SEA domain-containing protein n=1 Tax=Ilyomonas limi TaxID=2575867 RepID=A0A4U3KSQ0_9BACT|nr:hypothetical protein [Ilyomonas limi]TKK65398.1 hypothetical protein FC093_20015 [Ilyomonas limi]